jgi:hypothetical protein
MQPVMFRSYPHQSASVMPQAGNQRDARQPSTLKATLKHTAQTGLTELKSTGQSLSRKSGQFAQNLTPTEGAVLAAGAATVLSVLSRVSLLLKIPFAALLGWGTIKLYNHNV